MVKGLVDIARRHELVIFSDEIYEKILFDDAQHLHTAAYAGDDVLCLTFSGLSKAYRVCGYRAGWVMISGPKHLAEDYLEGLTLLANMRMCPNVPAQHAIQTALGGYQSINEYIVPGGRFYEQRKAASRQLNESPGSAACNHAGRCTASRGSTRTSTGSRTTSSSSSTCCAPRSPGHPRHRLQLVRARPLPVGHAARHGGAHQGDRPDRRLPEHPALSDAIPLVTRSHRR